MAAFSTFNRHRAIHLLLAAGVLVVGFPQDANSAERLFVDLRQKPDRAATTAFEISVVRHDADLDLEPAQAQGHRVIAKLGSLAHDSFPQIMASAVRRGFNGFVVYVDGEATEELQSKRVHDLLADYPDKEIFLEGDFVHLRSVWADVDGIFSTGILNRVERRSGNLLPLHPLESLPLQKALVVARKAGLKTLVMDFGDPTHPAAVAETASSIRDMGAIPFISNNVRGGVIVGPWHERARTVVVVHGAAGPMPSKRIRPSTCMHRWSGWATGCATSILVRAPCR
jgi:hypothetical protein